MVHLELVSPDETLSLDSVFKYNVGLEATSGVMGLGFPDVENQYTAGAGDGSRRTHSRVLERDIDIPIYADGGGRAGLKELVSRLAVMLSDECVLRFVDDDDTSWDLTVHRVGGGNYTYGVDTTGDRDLQSVFTVRAVDPFWRSTTGEGGSLAAPAGGVVELENSGDAAAAPVIRVDGPALDLEAVSPAGDVLAWDGVLDTGEFVEIDFDKHTVIDDLGRSRWGELAPGSAWWKLKPGKHDYTIGVDNSSESLLPALGQTRHNLVKNPTFVNAADWDVYNRKLGKGPSRSIDVTYTYPHSTVGRGQQARVYFQNKDMRTETYQDVSGLEVGKVYTAGAEMYWRYNKRTRVTTPPFLQVGEVHTSKHRKYLKPYKGIHIFDAYWHWEYPSVTFTATDEIMRLWLVSSRSATGGHSNIVSFTNAYIVEGTRPEFFTGDTPDVAGRKLYSWEGTPKHSRSVLTVPAGSVDTSDTNISVSWNPRKWAMV